MKIDIYNKLKKQPASRSLEDTSDKILLWGYNNDKPLQMVTAINRSVTGAACMSTLKKYVYGDGFANQDTGNIKVNATQTLDDLLQDIVSSICKFNGFSLVVKYNGAGQVAMLYNLPFESTRLSTPDERGNIYTLKYNPYFGTSEYDKRYTEIYPLYNPAKLGEHLSASEGNFKGQAFWFGQESEFNRFYPLPSWYADNTGRGNGKDAMQNEYLLSRLLNEELDAGFLQNVLMKIVGDPDAPIKEHVERYQNNETYTTVAEQMREDLNRHFAGVEGDKMIVFWSRIKEEFPEIQPFPSNFNYEKLQDVKNTVKTDIATATGVPLVLANVDTSGAISKDDIQSSVYLMHANARTYQNTIESQLKKIFQFWHQPIEQDFAIKNFFPFKETKEVPQNIWRELNKAQKLKWIEENTDIDTSIADEEEALTRTITPSQESLRSSVGGVQAIVTLQQGIKEGTTTPSSAIAILEFLFGFTPDQARQIVGQVTQDLTQAENE